MKQTVTQSMFKDAFRNSQYKDNFTYEGLRLLFEYLEQYEQDSGRELELDVVALCCDYAQDDLEAVLKNYSLESIDDLRDNTMVLECSDGTVIYQVF